MLDSGDQFFNAAEAAPSVRPPLRNDPKPGLLLVEPGAVGEGVLHIARVPLSQPAPGPGVLVGALVIHDHVDVDLIGGGLPDLAQKRQKLPKSSWLLFSLQKTHIRSLQT